MSQNVMEFMVFVVEKTARAFFANDKTTAYNTLKQTGIWDFYVQNYETTHSFGIQALLEEIKDIMLKKGVAIC